MSLGTDSKELSKEVALRADQILNAPIAASFPGDADSPVLVVLAAGKGTRFGKDPKCIQLVANVPLARHSINAFKNISPSPSICLVGYQAENVTAALGDDNLYILSNDPAGGTAMAAYEAFALEQLKSINPVVVVTMGDRIVPESIFRELLTEHHRDGESELTMMTAIYQPPKNHGKGRIVRDGSGAIQRIIEQRDIDALPVSRERERLQLQPEGNCPLYAVRAETLLRYLGSVTNDNAQQQYYFTDIIEAIRNDGGIVRSITFDPGDSRYQLLCADVTRPKDLSRLESILRQASDRNGSPRNVATSIAADRPAGQIESIAAQLSEIVNQSAVEHGFQDDGPIGIGISGGRLRIAFMHPDMSRFYGPAWQMPIGAPEESGREQIVVLMQPTHDGMIRLVPTDPKFRESKEAVSASAANLFPGPEVSDVHGYEAFGTKMAETILAELGYVTEMQNAETRKRGETTPPESSWVSNNMRRPFSLLANAIASIRTIREGDLGNRVQHVLGKHHFEGLNVVSTGDIPRGGFSSSSAFTVATQNGLNALFGLAIDSDRLVDLACQAEYGTGVRAGALDQATEQLGKANQGALISSNPREHYRIINTFPVPTNRFRVLFPYTVDRDKQASRWSMGYYANRPDQPQLTTSETRKMTGKAAEIAAILLRLPLDRDFFPEIEQDLVETGELTASTTLHIQDRLRSIPLLATQLELQDLLHDRLSWYSDQLMEHQQLTRVEANELAATTLRSLLTGWRDPTLSRAVNGRIVSETGAPLRAMVGYLYGEVAKNCYLIQHPESWIESVSQSQRGDRCFLIDPDALPDKASMLAMNAWEQSANGFKRMELWLKKFGAQPVDFNDGLSDEDLANHSPIDLRRMAGTNFFRGLPLIDLAEAMLKRAFGRDVVAVRINGAGQGDYFQIHVDLEHVDPEEVKEFIRVAFYKRFSLNPEIDFVEPHPGGGAAGVKLDRFNQLPLVIEELYQLATQQRSKPAVPISDRVTAS